MDKARKNYPTFCMINQSSSKPPYKRAWIDGCFDMMHFGHANAIFQAKQLAEFLVVGVHSDVEILRNKGPTVMNEKERYAAVRACKWVDLLVEDAPYITSLDLMDKYDCEICIHGDDITLASDGSDCYQAVKDANRFLPIIRTAGISTTELVGRMLTMSREHLNHGESSTEPAFSPTNNNEIRISPYTKGDLKFLTTTRRLLNFSNNREPGPNDKIIYVDGTFDIFHAGHVELLKEAKALGDYLLVGLHDDQTVNRIKGYNYPLLNLHERALSVLSCRYVDEVIIGAPYDITQSLLEQIYPVNLVIHGKTPCIYTFKDPYSYPKSLGIYCEIETQFSYLSVDVIIERILSQRKTYEERNRKKVEKELRMLNLDH